MSSTLRLSDLEVSYGDLRAVRGASFEVAEGGFTTLLGSNGAGKTTILKAVSGAVRIRSGKITLADVDLVGMNTHDIARLGVAHVPEGRRVFNNMTVLENLEVGSYMPAARALRAETLAYVFDLFPRLAERRPQLAGTLSGGEQQMLAIGRALMTKPKFLMLDEPSQGLAPVVVENLFKAIARIHEGGVTLLLVEQNASLALEFAQHGVVLENGSVVLQGVNSELIDSELVANAYLGV